MHNIQYSYSYFGPALMTGQDSVVHCSVMVPYNMLIWLKKSTAAYSNAGVCVCGYAMWIHNYNLYYCKPSKFPSMFKVMSPCHHLTTIHVHVKYSSVVEF